MDKLILIIKNKHLYLIILDYFEFDRPFHNEFIECTNLLGNLINFRWFYGNHSIRSVDDCFLEEKKGYIFNDKSSIIRLNHEYWTICYY